MLLLDRQVILDGMPVALDAGMRPVEPLSSWFRHSAFLGRDVETMRSYAYVVLWLTGFLATRGRDVMDATETDLLAYRRQRLTGTASWFTPRATGRWPPSLLISPARSSPT
ncbi:hypothetical protein ABZ442_20120 [Streptomyces triculaminicus]|uniref:hypothetical protein n=1 Tax=Streptomyces triculaminicus TaxID=2816232 RepID=UPI0033DDFC0A